MALRKFVPILAFCIAVTISGISGMIHSLHLENDDRSLVQLTSFGFIKGGQMRVDFELKFPKSYLDSSEAVKMGFTLDKTTQSQKSEIVPSWDDNAPRCVLKKRNDSLAVVFFEIDFTSKLITIDKHGDVVANLSIGIPTESMNVNETVSPARSRRAVSLLSDSFLFERPSLLRRRRQAATEVQPVVTVTPAAITATTETFDGTIHTITMMVINEQSGVSKYHAIFLVKILCEDEEGLYNLAFYNCYGKKVNLTVSMTEENNGNFLSVGQMPLPAMYFVFSIVYFFVGIFWHWILYSSQEGVCKIHYLMLVLLYIKSMSLLFHGINIYFMQDKGRKEEAVAILFYIVYLMKGIIMFLTIVLIGAGWTFVRHILSDRDKKIFVIVIPLQILVNVASIFVSESEQGQMSYTVWREAFYFLDLMCCGAILFPIVGSIRHLQQASQTDGKAAANLEKLKIFRHFYILVVCFIYFTRIIVLLVSITVPFRYEWLDKFFVELATIGFFVLTGYKFRPASNNPYLQVSTSDDEDEQEEIVTKSGALENVIRVNVKTPHSSSSMDRLTESGEPLLKQRGEGSHEYD